MNILFPPHQEYVLLMMLFTGFVIGIIYDIFEFKRRLFPFLNFYIFIDDILFTVISAVIFIISVFVFNNGIVRWYEYFLLAFGFFLYKSTLSHIVLLAFGYIADSIRYIFAFIIGIFNNIFFKLFKVLLFVIRCIIFIIKPLMLNLFRRFTLFKLINNINKRIMEVK